MGEGYLKAAWHDLIASPHWLAKMFVLALVGLIPIFGPMVVYGYLYGWARDAAWGMYEPLPLRIFANEDGLLFRRGFFALVIITIFTMVPKSLFMLFESFLDRGIVHYGGNGLSSLLTLSAPYGFDAPFAVFAVGMSVLILLLMNLAVLFMEVLAWIGCMRMSLYGRLSPGFQLGRIWAMLRHDAAGVFRIFCLYFGANVFVYALYFALFVFFFILFAFIGVDVSHGSFLPVLSLSEATGGGYFLFVAVVVLSLVFLPFCTATIEAFTIRAIGRWTAQFDVDRWGGQDDPLPFERVRTPSFDTAPQQTVPSAEKTDSHSYESEELDGEEPEPRNAAAACSRAVADYVAKRYAEQLPALPPSEPLCAACEDASGRRSGGEEDTTFSQEGLSR